MCVSEALNEGPAASECIVTEDIGVCGRSGPCGQGAVTVSCRGF